MIKRSPEMYLAAYALSRFGQSAPGGGPSLPPPWLRTGSWKDAYGLFFDALGSGRDIVAFRNSLKNARDSFDRYTASGRIGWKPSAKASAGRGPNTEVIRTLDAWKDRREDEVRDAVLRILSTGQPSAARVSAETAANRTGTPQHKVLQDPMTRVRPIDREGRALDAEVSISGLPPSIEVTFECADGRRRNRDYNRALELVLSRLGHIDARLVGGAVTSNVAVRRRAAEGIPTDLRLDDFTLPLSLRDVSDWRALRTSIGRAGARVGKPSGTSGNTTKRISLELALASATEEPSALFRWILTGATVSDEGAQPDEESEPATDPATLEALAVRYRDEAPIVRARMARSIERGGVGEIVKRLNDYRCQICEALGLPSKGFRKRNGGYYVEAHHVEPVSLLSKGLLGPANVVSVCANHHRELHYGEVTVEAQADAFEFTIDGRKVSVLRCSPRDADEPSLPR